MAKVKVINPNLNGNLNGSYFNDTPSNTIFSFGKFFVTSNFDNKVTVNYSNILSSFVRPVTLETMGVSDVQSEILHLYSTNAVLNLDKSDLNTFVRYGSAYEFLRVSVQNIILAYPGSLFANSQKTQGGNLTFSGLTYDSITNIATFYVPTGSTVNTFGLVFNSGNTSNPDNKKLKNLNQSFDKYVIWSTLEPNSLFPIIGFTGNTINSSYYLERLYLRIQVSGNPFAMLGTGSTAKQDFHIRPNNIIFEEFRALLNGYEQNIVSERKATDGFVFTLKDPTLLDDGTIIYSNTQTLWTTGDKYNIDVSTPNYQQFLKILLTIGAKYDKIKTDLIARFLTPTSLKTYDFTEEGKMTKLLRIYGREFDQIRQFIDSLVYINKVTYDKINNIPDQLVKNLANTFGWDYFSLVNESELVDSFLTVDDQERNLNEDILPAEIDVELWRRILNNTSYFWKSKGTREAIKSMFLLIGIPEPFINITEYVYTVDGKIDPRNVGLTQADFPSNSLPYDTEGYPVAPLETSNFFFQISGDTDSGQAYLNVFRMAGFDISPTVDNKKSWVEAGVAVRVDDTTPQYYQEDSKLVINTKEIDVALDTARGIEYDVFRYIKDVDFPANSSGYTLPYSYVNISLTYSGNQDTFTLPYNINNIEGDFEVRFNGILLNAPSISGVTSLTEADYGVTGSTFKILNGNYAINSGSRRDVIQATLITSGATSAVTGITVEYIVTRVKAVLNGTYVPLPSYPRGDVQVTINGIALTKGTPQFTADYILDPANSTGGSNNIIISNPDVITYLNANPDVQISYVEVLGSNDINLRSEVIRVDSFNSSKIYFNNSANKYVYKLNYKVNNASEVKFLIDGIALEPLKDYNINVMNPYEIFLPKGIRYGTVISAYYLVGGNAAFAPVVADSFGIGDISKLSFLEFIELIQRKMINARNRKTISDFKGGWYPALLRIYEMYLERALLPNGDPLQSNGYTFENLYPFLSKYNAFFQRFVDQLLAATIIIKKGGLLVRNTVFTKQKFMYKRGVNVGGITYETPPTRPDSYEYGGTPPIGFGNLTGRASYPYLGDDGSVFAIGQEQEPLELYTETKAGTAGIGALNNIGGKNIVGFASLTSYGIQYKKSTTSTWTQYPLINGSLPSNTFNLSISGLDEDTNYNYRAIVNANTLSATGNTLTLKTSKTVIIPLVPSGHTKQNTSSTNTTLVGTGGKDIQRYEDVTWYGMQYSAITSSIAFNVKPLSFTNISTSAQSVYVGITGETSNIFTATPNVSWLVPHSPPAPPTPAGISQEIFICVNTSIARTGCVVYHPTVGADKCVVVSQNAAPVSKTVSINCALGGHGTNYEDADVLHCGTLTSISGGESYYVQFGWCICKTSLTTNTVCVEVKCNNVSCGCCCYNSHAKFCSSGTFPTFAVDSSDCVDIITCATIGSGASCSNLGRVSINTISGGVGGYIKGSPSVQTAATCGTPY